MKNISMNDLTFDPQWQYENPQTKVSYRNGIIAGSLFFSSLSGNIAIEDAESVVEVLERIFANSRFDNTAYVRITDYSNTTGGSFRARQKYVRTLKRINGEHNCRPSVTYICGANAVTRATLLFAQKILGQNFVFVSTVDEAFELANTSRLAPDDNIELSREADKSVAVSQKDIDALVQLAGSVAWDESPNNSTAIDAGSPLNLPYQALQEATSDMRELMQREREQEEELHTSQNRLELAMDAGEHGFWDWNMDTDDVYFSPRYYTMLGYEPGELPMKLTTWVELMHPDDRESVVPKIKKWVKNAWPYEIEFRLKTKDGEWKWISGRGKSFEKDEKGIPHRAVGVHVDITDRKQAEETLREAEQDWRDSFNSLEDVMLIIDRDYNIKNINDNGLELVQKSKDDVIGKKCYQIIHGTETPAEYCPFRKAVETKKPESIERYEDIFDRHFSIKNSPIFDENGEIVRFVDLISDITERKQAEEKFEIQRAQIKSLFDYSSEAMVLFDLENHIIDVNLAFENMFGYLLKEAHGKVIEDLICPERFYHTESKELDEQALQGIKGAEIIRMRKDGKEINVRVSAGPIKVNNIITGRFAIFDDITQRKQAETELTQTKNFLQNILDSSIDGITTTDLQGNVIYTSPRKKDILGYEQEETISKKAHSFYGNGIEDAKLIMKELKEKGELRDHEMKFIRKDDTLIDINLSASLLRNEEGDVTGTLGIYRDITEKNMLENQLAQTQRMEALGTLAGGIAHNFNNLLMGIQGNASLMLLETNPAHPNYQKLKTIEKSVQSGARLTRQLLGYAREGRYEIKPISLNLLVKETSDTFSMAKKEIRVHQELAQDLFGIKADQGQIEQALLNLYVNAADAMPGGGDLFLKTINITHKNMKKKPYKAKPGNYVLLTVRDTGTGMDKETMNRIFDPFFTTKGLAKGTGLGLASTYGIIKGYGGYIDVDSEKGQGTTFSIYLPASEKRIEKTIKSTDQIIEGRGAILLVDDEEIVLDVGVQLLKALGYKVLEAKGGREAVEIYRENKDKINMVLLDMVMPDMGGGEVYDKMKEINPDIKVLLSSGYSIDGRAEEILKRGCNGFIQKPFNMKGISEKIREILDKG